MPSISLAFGPSSPLARAIFAQLSADNIDGFTITTESEVRAVAVRIDRATRNIMERWEVRDRGFQDEDSAAVELARLVGIDVEDG